MIVYIYPNEAATYEKWCGPDWRVDMFGPNTEVRIVLPIPTEVEYKANKYIVKLPVVAWRLLNQGVSIAPPKADT